MLHVIVNPVAGRSGCLKAYAKLKALLDDGGIAHKAHISSQKGDVTRLAARAVSEGASAVAVMGGDGTVSEAARALAGTGVPLGILPGGTGNDLAQTLGIPRELESALDVVLGGCVRSMDAGSLNGRCFVNVAGAGFDVLTLRNAERFKRILTGLAGYAAAVLVSVFTTRPKHIVLETPHGVMERDVLLVAFANGCYYGGGMRVAPEAEPYDGMLDILIVNSVPRWRIPVLLSRFVKGKHLSLEFCEYFRAPWAKLGCGDETEFNIDGDIEGIAPADIRVLPGALRVFVPAADKNGEKQLK